MRSPAFHRISLPPFLNTCTCFTLLVVASGSLALAQSDNTLHFILDPPLLIGAGEAFAAHVEVRDDDGDPDDDFDPDVVVALAGGAPGLSGTTARKVDDDDGIARFDDLSVGAGGIYRLVVTAGSATPDTSRAFTVLGNAADELEFGIQPTDTEAGAEMATVEVRAVLAPGITDPLFSGDITIRSATSGRRPSDPR